MKMYCKTEPHPERTGGLVLRRPVLQHAPRRGHAVGRWDERRARAAAAARDALRVTHRPLFLASFLTSNRIAWLVGWVGCVLAALRSFGWLTGWFRCFLAGWRLPPRALHACMAVTVAVTGAATRRRPAPTRDPDATRAPCPTAIARAPPRRVPGLPELASVTGTEEPKPCPSPLPRAPRP